MSNLASELLLLLDDESLDELARRLKPRFDRLASESTVEDGWIDAKGAAEYLGMSVHALHRLTAERRIPFSQDGDGARCYFKRSRLDAWRDAAAHEPR